MGSPASFISENLPEGVSFQSRGEGAVGPLLWGIDWSRTALGPCERWPTTLQGYVRMILALPTPAIIFWGPELVQLYNDGYSQIMGPRHPQHLGSTYRECWPDTFPTIHPWMQRVLGGEVVIVERTLIPLTRYGFDEEAFFSFTFTPLRDDEGRIAGILQLVNEMTASVLAERRGRTLRDIAAARADSGGALAVLGANPGDVAFSMLFRPRTDGRTLDFEGATGFAQPPESDALARAQEFAQRAFDRNQSQEAESWNEVLASPVRDLRAEPAGRVVALPIRRGEGEPPRGVLLLGASPRLRFDEPYREFFSLLACELAARWALDQEVWLTDQLKLTLESAQMGTWHLDLRTRRIAVSERTAEFLGGIAAGEHPFADLTALHVHPEDRSRVESGFRRIAATGEVDSTEYRILRGDGEVRWIQSWGRAHRDAGGTTASISGVSLDITDRKQVEAQLREAVRARDEFLSIASHELKTPLSSLTLSTQGMSRALDLNQPDTLTPDRVRRLLQQTERQTRRLSRLVDDMLDVSRINAGKLVLNRERVDLADLVQDTIERLRPNFESTQTPLDVACARGVWAQVDRDRLDQVLMNLLTNAIRYASQSPVRVEVWSDGAAAHLRVTDRGPGIAPVDHRRVFEQFERAISANEVSGLGLGLFISRQIVEAHGGRIALESTPGHGARFTVSVPALDS